MGREYSFKPIEDLVFADDFMFGAVMHEPKICKGVIELLLGIKIDHIEYPELQKTISPYYNTKGVRLDVYMADSDRVFDVECQSYNIENIGKRTRYYQSMLDMDSLLKGSDYSELKESYIIFICLEDPFGDGLPVYTFERTCKENSKVDLNDKTHHIVFNCSAYNKEKNPEIKSFLSFVKGNDASSKFTKEINAMVQTKKFQNTFINEYLAIRLHERDVEKRATERGMQKGIQQGIQKGIQQGIQQGKIDAYVDLIKSNLLSVKDVAEKLGMAESEVQKLLEDK